MTDNRGWTALHYSARTSCFELVTSFTALGTDVNLKTIDGWNCLHIASNY